MRNVFDISIILPCLNEEAAIRGCLCEIKETINNHRLNAEVIVVDNNSTDRSAEIVSDVQATFPELRLVFEMKEGYGSAYHAGLRAARGKYIFMADADGTYSFSDIPVFLSKLKDGNDLVLGNRFSGSMAHAAMPWLHRYIGNPFLSFLVRRFFGVRIRDIHCGVRAISRTALDTITLTTTGMEFASEMVIKAAKQGLRIVELPVAYNARKGESKLKAFSDGWRHLRFILLYSPFFLFFLPGITLFFLGVFFFGWFYFFEPTIFGVQFHTHPLFVFSIMMILGYQITIFAGFSKIYAITHLGDRDPFVESLFRHITLERAGIAGMFVAACGSVIYLVIFFKWIGSGFGDLSEIKTSIVALTLFVLGAQTFFSGFMMSILGIRNK